MPHSCQVASVVLHRHRLDGTEGEGLEQEHHRYQGARDGCMRHQRRQGVLVLVVDGGEELEREVVVDMQVEEGVLLAVELVMEARRLEELGRAGAGDAGVGEGVRGRNRCILQRKSEVDPSSDQSCAQD